MDDRTDAALVAAALDGQTEAFCALVRKYQDFAYGIAVGQVSDFDLARDIVQEACLTAYRELEKLRDHSRFPGWLHGIVRNTARRSRRQLARVQALAADLCRTAQPFAPTLPPDELAEQAERREMVRRALEGLGEKSREAVSLYYVNGYSYADIAALLRVPKATVKGRIQRGRGQLREELTMVEKTFKDEELPEDFAAEIRGLLEHAASRGEERESAIRRIAEIGGPAVAPLCDALDDPIHTVRLLAARALCAIGDARALDPVLDRADPWGEVFKSGRVLAIDGMRDALLEIVRGQRPGDVSAAVAALGHATGDEEAYAAVLSVFQGEQPGRYQARAPALSALCQLKPDAAAEFVSDALCSTDPHLRDHASWQAKFPNIMPRLDACLEALGRDCKRAGFLALKHGEAGREALTQILRTGSKDKRAAAAVALATTGSDEAFDVLRSEVLDARRVTKWREYASYALARHYRAKLVEWVAEGAPSAAALWTLARSRPKEDVPAVEEALHKGTPAVREAALRILARQRGASFVPELRRCLREGRPKKVACEAFQQMRRLPEAALPDALDMFESEHWTERKSATLLLKYWGKLTKEQHQRAKQDPHVAVRDAARLPSESPQCMEWAKWHPKWRKRVEKVRPRA